VGGDTAVLVGVRPFVIEKKQLKRYPKLGLGQCEGGRESTRNEKHKKRKSI